MPNLIDASKTNFQHLYDLPPEDGVAAVPPQWENSSDSGNHSTGSLDSFRFRADSTSVESRHASMPQWVGSNGVAAVLASTGSGSQEDLRASRGSPKNNNLFDEADDKHLKEIPSAPPRAHRTPTPESLPASAIIGTTSDTATSSAGVETSCPTLKMLQQLRVKGYQKPLEAWRTHDAVNGGIAATVANEASLTSDPLDVIGGKWTKLHDALNRSQRAAAPDGDTSSAADTPIARNCGAFYDSLMRHARHGSALSFKQVAKALQALTLDAGTTDHAQFRDTLRYTTLQPHLGSAPIEDLFRLARLRDPNDRSRAEITSMAGKQLIAALAKNKAAAKAAVPLADALLDAMGNECHRAIQQRWINNVKLTIAANRALKAAPPADREREAARLVGALRELAIISQRVDIDQSARQRLRDLHIGLSPRLDKELDDMLGIGIEESEHANAKHFDQFLNVALPGYEADAGMQARMFTFIEQWRNARQDNPAALRREQDFSNLQKSGYHRSWAPVRFFSRLRQLLTGKDKQEPIKTRNEIKDLVAALTTGKPVRHELKGIDHLNRIFLATPPDASNEQKAKRAEFKAYLQHTLRKLTPQEARALHESLVKARQDQETMAKSELRALGWTEALCPELERALEREVHVRELVQCVADTNVALNMSRFTAARQHKRGEALIAAMDKLAQKLAEAPEVGRGIAHKESIHESAFDLLKEAVARTVDFDGVPSNDRRIVEQAVSDMNALLEYKCPQWGQARTGTLYTLADAGYLATR